MKRSARVATAVSFVLVGLMCARSCAVNPVNTVQWVGGSSGEWNTGSVWKNTTTGVTDVSTTAAIYGQNNGSDGMNDNNPANTRARNILITGGSTVTYNAQLANQDFRVKQGSNLTITGGGTWVQPTDGTYSDNRWTQMDPSNLTIDNGTFRRSGRAPGGLGGGVLMFGSYRAEDNVARLGSPVQINVGIVNGGLLENQGQLWFGSQEDQPADIRVKFNINNGTMNLNGGTISQTNDYFDAVADLAFTYDYDEVNGAPKNEKYEINFTGPGSITVNSAGIKVYTQDSSSIWNVSAPVSTYQDLWNLGILKANGLSGATGATFSNFFTVAGTAGANNYKLTSVTAPIATVQWVGGASGEWNTGSVWKNTTTNVTDTATAAGIFGQNNGSDGMTDNNPVLTRARNIVITGGSTVNYNAQAADQDFRTKQGTNFTVTGGATWQQVTDNTYSDNRWTEWDGSNLTIDNGTFRRSGEAPGGLGGGVLMFGSWRSADQFDRLGVGSSEINVNIKNGGKLENTGQLWFGSQEDQAAGIRVKFNIDNGSMTLNGGTISQTNDYFDSVADLAFMYDYDEVNGQPKNEKYEINFTGPGSITVNSAGIKVYTQDSSSIWNVGAAVSSYLDLWNLGILKANGLSGLTGADFATFFTTSGTPGANNYTLNSLITAPPTGGVPGDYNNNGVVDAADYVLWRNGGPLQNEVDTPGTVNAADYTAWRARFGNTSGSGAGLGSAAVPEPTSALLLLVGVVSFLSTKRRVR